MEKFKTTEYFKRVRIRPDRISIKEEWILKAIKEPIQEKLQSDKRIRRWAKIEDAENRILRVVLLEDGETVHNAFFDRGYKEE